MQSFDHKCGAVILSGRWLLTAANCVFGYQNNPQVFDIITANHNLDVRDPFEKVNDVRDIYIHPDYSPLRNEWNFAMLRSKGVIPFNDDWTLDVCLPAQDDIFPGGTEAVITGWGDTEGGVLSNVLLQANITVNDDEYCNDPSRHNGAVTESLMCAGTPSSNTDACVGDDGGPVVWYRPIQDELDPNPDDERWYLIGISGDRTTSGANPNCADPDLPGLYGNVASAVSWIEYILTTIK
ncbi:transmembrane protease serine 11D-like [Glandiceps talaboti]